jgi:hypothetical protein
MKCRLSTTAIGGTGGILSARAHVTGLGAFYFYVNGNQAGDHVMDPPQTVYPKRIIFRSFDITSQLKVLHSAHVAALLV